VGVETFRTLDPLLLAGVGGRGDQGRGNGGGKGGKCRVQMLVHGVLLSRVGWTAGTSARGRAWGAGDLSNSKGIALATGRTVRGGRQCSVNGTCRIIDSALTEGRGAAERGAPRQCAAVAAA
jgi:hypothetical protein